MVGVTPTDAALNSALAQHVTASLRGPGMSTPICKLNSRGPLHSRTRDRTSFGATHATMRYVPHTALLPPVHLQPASNTPLPHCSTNLSTHLYGLGTVTCCSDHVISMPS